VAAEAYQGGTQARGPRDRRATGRLDGVAKAFRMVFLVRSAKWLSARHGRPSGASPPARGRPAALGVFNVGR
jgi:hypothetical protein